MWAALYSIWCRTNLKANHSIELCASHLKTFYRETLRISLITAHAALF